MNKRNGFTLIELVVVIAIIGILVTIAAVTLVRYQQDGRDARRTASVWTISKALESYYDRNGEYPGCTALTSNATAVTTNTLKGLDKDVLLVPLSSAGETNSIRCGQVLLLTGVDFFEYKGVGTLCTSTGTCSQFTLRYRNEGDNVVLAMKSQRGF